MSRESVGQALNMMDDDDIRAKVAAGDLSALGDLEFDEAEAAVVVDAARDFPDTSGFAFSMSRMNFKAAPPAGLNFAANGRFGEASHYAFGKLAGPNIAGHMM